MSIFHIRLFNTNTTRFHYNNQGKIVFKENWMCCFVNALKLVKKKEENSDIGLPTTQVMRNCSWFQVIGVVYYRYDHDYHSLDETSNDRFLGDFFYMEKKMQFRSIISIVWYGWVLSHYRYMATRRRYRE